ncbi:MAG: serine/threonine-protein kinase [Myxococcota bacterium]
MEGRGVTLSCQQFQGGNLLRVSGVIDESFDPEEFVRLAGHGAVIVDLAEVHRITSFGVREWIRALRDMTASYLGLIGCRPTVMAQLNTVHGFGGSGDVITLFAPYVCPRCSEEIEEHLDLRVCSADVRAGNLPRVECPRCREVAEFDDIPSTYFAYVTSKGEPHPPLDIQRVLACAIGGRLRAPLSIRKEVRTTVTAVWLAGALDERARLRRVVDGVEGDVVMLLGGLTDCTTEGLVQLQRALEPIDIPVYFAHVTPQIATQLAEHDDTGRWRVASVLVPARCCECDGELEFVVGAQALDGVLSPGFRCRSCGSPEAPTLDPTAVKTAMARVDRAVPEPLTRYLEDLVAKATTTLSPGSSGFYERYEIVDRLGGGGMAEVSLARLRGEEGFSKLVVIKQLHEELTADQGAVTMFLREARLAARIGHPNVVQIFNLGRRDGRHFIAMEYVDGWDLRELRGMVQDLSRPFPVVHALRIAAAVAAGLHAAHTMVSASNPESVVHCDVSARNVLVSRCGAIKLTDFGIARVLQHFEGALPETVWGTPAYMAPEQLHPALGKISPRTDIYGLGAVLFELLTDSRPPPCPVTGEEVLEWAEQSPPRVLDFRPEVPAVVGEIVDRALTRRPAGRYVWARDMQRDLEFALEKIGARPGSTEFSRWLEITAKDRDNAGSLSQRLAGTGRQRIGHDEHGEHDESRRTISHQDTNRYTVASSELELRPSTAVERLRRSRRRDED